MSWASEKADGVSLTFDPVQTRAEVARAIRETIEECAGICAVELAMSDDAAQCCRNRILAMLEDE